MWSGKTEPSHLPPTRCPLFEGPRKLIRPVFPFANSAFFRAEKGTSIEVPFKDLVQNALLFEELTCIFEDAAVVVEPEELLGAVEGQPAVVLDL